METKCEIETSTVTSEPSCQEQKVQQITGTVESLCEFLVALHVCSRKNISSWLLVLSKSSLFDMLIYFNPGRAEQKVFIRKDFVSERPLWGLTRRFWTNMSPGFTPLRSHRLTPERLVISAATISLRRLTSPAGCAFLIRKTEMRLKFCTHSYD